MENEPKVGAAVTPPPSPSPPAKVSWKKGSTPGYSATEDTFKDTAECSKNVKGIKSEKIE